MPVSALLDILGPVVALIAVGFVAARRGLIDRSLLSSLSNVTFSLMAPALLFRSMAASHFESLSFEAPAAYYGAGLPLFLAVLGLRLARRRKVASAAVGALAATYSNAVMLGIPLVRLAYGEAGFSLLLTIVALHSLVLVTIATIVLELGRAHASGAADGGGWGRAVAGTVRGALLHPVILPILLGIAYSLSGLPLPAVADRTLDLLGSAAPPLCLLLLGASLAGSGSRDGLRDALWLTFVKSLVHPALVWAVGAWVLGSAALPLAVATVTAALPIGNNVYLFAQRYDVDRDAVSGGVLLSTLACALTLPPLLGMLAVR